MTLEEIESKVTSAAIVMDWQQVVHNGGPPCFRLESNGRFCWRAHRWHVEGTHQFVSLADLVQGLLGVKELDAPLAAVNQ